MKNHFLFFLLMISQLSYAQVIKSVEVSTKKCWVLSSNLNLPAAKFHFINDASDMQAKEVKGYLELFSSFGIGLSLNYGEALLQKIIDNNNVVDEETDFSNLVGLQVGVLYSSKIADDQENSVNEFSLYGGLNILDLQIGVGYEYGARQIDASRWFVSVSYGIPIHKLTGRGSYVL